METPLKLSENLNISHFSVELKYMRGIKERKAFMKVSAHFLEVYCSVLGLITRLTTSLTSELKVQRKQIQMISGLPLHCQLVENYLAGIE